MIKAVFLPSPGLVFRGFFACKHRLWARRIDKDFVNLAVPLSLRRKGDLQTEPDHASRLLETPFTRC